MGEETFQESYYIASQGQLIWRKFKKHKLALIGAMILSVLYVLAIFCEFFAPQDAQRRDASFAYCPPQMIRFFAADGFHLRPFVYGLDRVVNPETWATIYVKNHDVVHPIYFFMQGDSYRMWGMFKGDVHLFGVREGTLFLFGSDRNGRDIFSRNLYAARISLSVGLLGIALSFLLGCILGGISGYFGGRIDTIIQRIIEFMISLPTIPLWMAISATLPQSWSAIQVYIGITAILSMVGWCGLARVVRGKLLELREEDFVMAAKIAGATTGRVILRHLLPSFASYLIITITLSIPSMILGETALSFLGLGLRPPVVSWGTLLQDAQKIQIIAQQPWLLIPGLFVIVTILAFNFLGDGLRDAADPYK